MRRQGKRGEVISISKSPNGVRNKLQVAFTKHYGSILMNVWFRDLKHDSNKIFFDGNLSSFVGVPFYA